MANPTRPFDAVDEPPADDPLIGRKLGEYVVERFLAQGGMGMVYAAVHPLLKRRAAVKVLRPELVRDKEQEERFLKEAQAISSISHRGIIQVLDFGHLPDRRQYMVMEFLEGKTLEALLHEEGPLPPNRALPIVDEVCDALSAAHGVDVVHRDLKPSNVFLARQSNGQSYAKLVDFGLAKSMGGKQSAKASVIAGTPEYISPEQARGADVTPQTDLYCLGVMIFEMISGGLPFAGTNLVEFLRAHIEQPAPRLSSYVQVPELLDDLVASLLEKDPALRPHSAEAVRRTIAQILRENRDASTMQVAAPRPEAPKLPARVTEEDPFAFEDTRRSGSSPVEAAKIKALRERASGPQPARPSRPSGSKRLSKPDIVAPLPRARQSSPRLQTAEADESHKTQISLDDDRTAPRPFEPVVPNAETSAQPPAPAARSLPVVPIAVAAMVLLGGAGGALAWKLTRPPPAPTEIVEVRPQPPAEIAPQAEVQPSPPTQQPPEDPALKEKLRAAAERERAMSKDHQSRDFSSKVNGMMKSGVKYGHEKDAAQEINDALANEVVEKQVVDNKLAADRGKGAERRDELRQVQLLGDLEAEFKDQCGPGWKKKAREDIKKYVAERKKALAKDPDAPGAGEALEALETGGKDLEPLIDSARNFESCAKALKMVKSFLRPGPL